MKTNSLNDKIKKKKYQLKMIEKTQGNWANL
jgi:hypothetical protein